MSFCACLSGNWVGYLRFTRFGPLSLISGDDMTPSSSTSISCPPDSPDASASAAPSPRVAIMLPIVMFTTSFIRVPAPVDPKLNEALPMCPSSGRTSAKSSLSPPQRKMSWPAAAGPFEPDTGASRKRPPLAVTAASISCMRSGVNVAQSTIDLPGPMAPRTDGKTASLASKVESIDHVTLHAETTSAAVSTRVQSSGYEDRSGAHAAAVRFHTTSLRPFFSRFSAMPRPMIPTPMKPIASSFDWAAAMVAKRRVVPCWMIRYLDEPRHTLPPQVPTIR
mmetsp:Transcript_102278/g.292775  ORF Transcript_102278/g.292775 Transcript_102278/m.292775 type:complete len:279 (-) Transcript_102278:36-872(-)